LYFISGEHVRDEVDGEEQEFNVLLIHLNSRIFTEVEYGYNIALLKLSAPAVMSKAVQLANLPKLYEQVPVGKKCYMIGTCVPCLYANAQIHLPTIINKCKFCFLTCFNNALHKMSKLRVSS
jgi:hypothetical protein